VSVWLLSSLAANPMGVFEICFLLRGCERERRGSKKKMQIYRGFPSENTHFRYRFCIVKAVGKVFVDYLK